MGNGVNIDLLLQIFFAAEGLALWKVPVPSAKTIIDVVGFDKVCETILNGEGAATERSQRVNQFSNTEKSYGWWHGLAKKFCSFYPLIIFTFIVLVTSVFFNMTGRWYRIVLTVAAALYFLTKTGVIFWTQHVASKYDHLCKEFLPVELKPESQKVTPVK